MKTIDSNHPPAGPRGWLLRLLGRLFFYETMSGNGACPVYLERWTLFDLRKLGYAVYLHRFLGDDWAVDPHDHPRRFISIGLWGWYWEDVYQFLHCGITEHPTVHPTACPRVKTCRFRAPWFRSFPANHLHRVRASECGNCWTLVIVCPKSRPWGFVRHGEWIPFKEYVFGGKARKSC